MTIHARSLRGSRTTAFGSRSLIGEDLRQYTMGPMEVGSMQCLRNRIRESRSRSGHSGVSGEALDTTQPLAPQIWPLTSREGDHPRVGRCALIPYEVSHPIATSSARICFCRAIFSSPRARWRSIWARSFNRRSRVVGHRYVSPHPSPLIARSRPLREFMVCMFPPLSKAVLPLVRLSFLSKTIGEYEEIVQTTRNLAIRNSLTDLT